MGLGLRGKLNIFIRRTYASIFSRNKILIKLNKLFLDLCLSALGYGNWRGMKESGEEFFINKYLSNKPINLCIDVGANIGNYSKLLLEKTNSKVISFEPLPFVFRKLSDNLSNYDDRIMLVNKGVGKKITIDEYSTKAEEAKIDLLSGTINNKAPKLYLMESLK